MGPSQFTHDVSRWRRHCRASLFIALASAAVWLGGCNGGSSPDATTPLSPPPSPLAGLPASATILDGEGQQTGWRHYQYDTNGTLARVVTYSGPFPPIGSVMPEFIAFLAEQPDTALGTHTLSIDRGGSDTRKSILHAEFDKRPGREVRCRIGGHVIKMGVGELLYP